MSRQVFVEMITTVLVTIEDEDVVRRVFSPELDHMGRTWQGTFYEMHSEDDVFEHLAYNRIANGYEDVSGLDGWADLPVDAASMRLLDCEPL